MSGHDATDTLTGIKQSTEFYILYRDDRFELTPRGITFLEKHCRRLGVAIESINSLARYEILTRILENEGWERFRKRLVSFKRFHERRMAMARIRDDFTTLLRLEKLMQNQDGFGCHWTDKTEDGA